MEINAPVGAAYAVDLLQGAKQVEYQNGHLRVTLAANSGTILLLTNKEGKRQGTEKGCLAEGKEDAAVDSPNQPLVKVCQKQNSRLLQELPGSQSWRALALW